MAIISMAQQARPKVRVHIELLRAALMTRVQGRDQDLAAGHPQEEVLRVDPVHQSHFSAPFRHA